MMMRKRTMTTSKSKTDDDGEAKMKQLDWYNKSRRRDNRVAVEEKIRH
jgi:hypothetical protein